ncbi:unnamed protein product [Amoebophrya sp. A120]|nr:unnamed protein product [Amoebophrya sp. A120]|eukprot:GSA120T00019505001.1
MTDNRTEIYDEPDSRETVSGSESEDDAPTPQIPGTDASDKEKKKKKKKDKKDKKEKKEKSKLESGVDEKKKKKDKKDGKPDELCVNELEGYIEKKEAKKEKKEQRSKMASEAFDGTKRSRKFGEKSFGPTDYDPDIAAMVPVPQPTSQLKSNAPTIPRIAEGEARAIRLQAGTDTSSSSDSSSDSSSSEGGRGPKNKATNLDSTSYYTSNVAGGSSLTKPGRHHRMSIHRHSSEHHLPLHHFSFYPEGSALSGLLVEVVSEENDKSCPTHGSVDCSPGSCGGSTSGSCGAENPSPRMMKTMSVDVESSFVFVPPVEPSQEMTFVGNNSRIVGEDSKRNTPYRIETCAARPGLLLQLPESLSGDATIRTSGTAHYAQLRDGASARACEEEEARKRDTNPEDANAEYYLDATPSRPRPRPAEMKIMRRGNKSHQEQQEASAARNNACGSSGSSIPNRVAQPNYRRPARARRRGIKDADKKPQRKGGGATGVSEGDGEDL